MSGVITPILDTLLHQVLGKRVETQPAQDMLEPVKPLTPGQAPRAVRSDSRLNPEIADTRSRAGVGESAERPPGAAGTSSQAPASTMTHFSPAARNIADILGKFPAPPSVVRPPAPLLAASEPAEAPVLATRLQHSIESSGLFYESHLARWYRGDMSRSMLEREPQMLLHLLRSPVARAPSGDEARSGLPPLDRVPVAPAPAGTGASLPQASGAPAGGASPGQGQAPGAPAVPADALAEASRAAQPPNREVSDDTLQGIVRHQLELLVTPTLRWEGDLWSGVFMALVIHVPEVLGKHAEGDGEQENAEDDEDPVWSSQLSLQLPQLGELDVQLYLRGATLSLTLQSDSEACVQALSGGRDSLTERLHRCGFDTVNVSVLGKVNEPGRDEN